MISCGGLGHHNGLLVDISMWHAFISMRYQHLEKLISMKNTCISLRYQRVVSQYSVILDKLELIHFQEEYMC
jgi:hypothetical protein